VHDGSPRHNKPFIRVNCAALPGGLVESELFGHERGAFTGASSQRPGRFELANGGTLFLDEIGEMPLEAQAKLLRVLQDGMVDRIGSTASVPVDVRIVAATNAHLQDAIKKGTFRSDLFYRLHVFPVSIPPLRERREDIPPLADHFLAQAAAKLKRRHLKLGRQSLERLLEYSWPGNVRELQSLIDRAVILSTGDTVEIDKAYFPKTSLPLEPPASEAMPTTLHQLEHEHIIAILNRTGWRIYGPQGAAAQLGLNPETLRSKIRKLGLKKPSPTLST
jgi:formate hydrogenlyase transcriptional activator